MKIKELITPAGAFGQNKIPSNPTFGQKALKSLSGVKQSVQNFPAAAKQGVQKFLSKSDNISTLATDISTIGGGPGIKDYTKADKQDDAKFQDLLNVLGHESLKGKVDHAAVTTAMMNMYQSDKQNPQERTTFINSVKELTKTHPTIKPEVLYKEYKPVFNRFQITQQDITA